MPHCAEIFHRQSQLPGHARIHRGGASLFISLAIRVQIVPRRFAQHKPRGRRKVQLHDVGGVESDGSELTDLSQIGTLLTLQVELDLFVFELELERFAQVVLEELLGRRKAEAVAEVLRHVGLGREHEVADRQGGNVVARVAEREDVLCRLGQGIRGDLSEALLPLSELFDGRSGDIVPENEVDLVRPGDGLADVAASEAFELLSLGAGLAMCGQIVDASLVFLRIDVEAAQDFILQYVAPGLESVRILRENQLEWLVLSDLDCDRLITGQGARAEGDGCVNLRADELGSHGEYCGL